MTLDDNVIDKLQEKAKENNIELKRITYSGILNSSEYNIRFDMDSDDKKFINHVFEEYNIDVRNWHKTNEGELAAIIDP